MQDKELKHEFELERVILFSDAVFAIIITIMVLDIKLPDNLRHAKDDEILHAFTELIPKLIGYIVSFCLVSAFWLRHLHIFKTLRNYDVPLVIRNLLFLFIISLFPFAISVITGTMSPSHYWSFDLYVSVIFAGTLAQTLVVAYIVKHRQKLCFTPETVETDLKWKVNKLNFITVPILLALMVVFSLLGWQQWVPYLVVIQAVILAQARKRFYTENGRKLEVSEAHQKLPY